ncbi:MAG: S9 family peptidase [Xanthomonadales bacterium]|nr:S9 family peptidase [Xanthomonadales bacterium]
MKLNLQRVVTTTALALSMSVSQTAFAERLPAKLFAQHAQYADVTLSPDGTHLAITTPVDNHTDLMIIDLSGKEEPSRLRSLPKEHVADPFWANDNRLVFGKNKKADYLEQPWDLGELYSINREMKEQKIMFGYQPDVGTRQGRKKDQGWASVIARRGEDRSTLIVQFQSWDPNEKNTYIYRLDPNTVDRKLIEKIPQESANVSVDHDSVPRFAISADLHYNPILRYRPTADADWQPVPKSLSGRWMGIWAFESDNNIAWAEIADAGEPTSLYKVNFAKGTREKVMSLPDHNTGGLIFAGFNPEPFAIINYLPKISIQYLDPNSAWAKLHAGLMKQFPGNLVTLEEFSRDDMKVLVNVQGDRNPGQYYIVGREKNSIAKVLDSTEGLDSAKLAPMRPVQFQNREGTTLTGMLTLPLEGKTPFPTVVMPHGGPHGASDYWGYDNDVQFLANRGYAVLQINFQGSGGRGEDFEKSTHRKWGTVIMDDIADGLKWAVAQNVVDANRVCIYGVSFGGYAALMNPIRHPDTYRCAIGYAGFYDMEMDYKKGDINDTRRGRNQIEAELGTDIEAMRMNSPARHADKVKIPVMLVHGKDDHRCPYAHYKMMLDGLKEAGTPVTSLVKDAEGHGFYKEENRIELYEKMEAFLDEHIGAKSK